MNRPTNLCVIVSIPWLPRFTSSASTAPLALSFKEKGVNFAQNLRRAASISEELAALSLRRVNLEAAYADQPNSSIRRLIMDASQREVVLKRSIRRLSIYRRGWMS